MTQHETDRLIEAQAAITFRGDHEKADALVSLDIAHSLRDIAESLRILVAKPQ